MKQRLKKTWRLMVVMTLAFALLPVSAAGATAGHLTPKPAYITLTGAGSVIPIISVGETVTGVMFEGLPDGIGVTDNILTGNGKGNSGNSGARNEKVDVYVVHEQTTVPFFGSRDFQDASVTRLTLSTKAGHEGEVLAAKVVISPDDGFKRFCSASMGTVAEGFDVPVFMTGEEDNSTTGGVQAGVAVVLNTKTGKSTAVPGMGRLNHENTIALPGYDQLALLTTDDTFSGPSSQLYMYLADDQDAVFDDEGSLYAFQVTHDSGGPVTAADPFNGANDYLDLVPGVDDFQGRFIAVPDGVAKGGQDGLEDWSNENNVFQFVRLEDLAYDKNDPSIVYIADTGRSRVKPDPATGRMFRDIVGPGQADNGSVFKMVFDANDPTTVTSFTVLAQGDNAAAMKYVAGFNAPDNMDTSVNSLMVQEDTSDAVIWQYDLASTWTIVATVNDPRGESSGIVDASEWFGAGSWLLDVQAHGTNIDEIFVDPNTHKREDGQLLLMTIPGS